MAAVEPEEHVSQLSAIELGIIENIKVAFGISILSCLQAEISVSPEI